MMTIPVTEMRPVKRMVEVETFRLLPFPTWIKCQCSACREPIEPSTTGAAAWAENRGWRLCAKCAALLMGQGTPLPEATP